MTNVQQRSVVRGEGSMAEISKFEVEGGVTEYHVMVHATRPEQSFQEQLDAVLNAYYNLIDTELKGASSVIKRYFLSDAANQYDTLLASVPEAPACACSVVEQAPLNGTKVALWAYLLTDIGAGSFNEELYRVQHGAYTHLWGGTSVSHAPSSEEQTSLLLKHYVMQLLSNGGHLADDCIRTWFFVQNVDVNYAGVVKARNEEFFTQNLTSKTHFISSTGINGRNADPSVLVQLDTYAVLGLKPEQIKFLYAPTHLNPTYEYGVSFERGTRVDYGDRRQVFISGTASIDNKGNILHVGDIRRQTERMWENVDALLSEAECGFEDVGQMIVYLRDVADYAVVNEMFEKRFPGIPRVIVHAPVCRPGWLIEMECMATKEVKNEDYPCY
ncbi:MAG: Rid family hydrolase [Prevotellamassilia sp.]|nr:Rid family hydrolase [Prevotellamassilia sp.]